MTPARSLDIRAGVLTPVSFFMSVSNLVEETALFVEAYSRYRKIWENGRGPQNLAPYGHVEFPSQIPIHLGMFQGMAEEFLRELANELNRLDTHIEQLGAWMEVHKRYDQEDQMSLIMEFIEPLATVTFGQPSALRSRYIFSLSHTSHQANLHSQEGWSESKLPSDGGINYKVMKRCSENWAAFTRFAERFDNIDDSPWKTQTREYRNKYHHRFPPRFELGQTEYITRSIHEDGNASYGFGGAEPLSIDSLLPHLREQHQQARSCFDLYSELIKEQWAAIYVS
jgi:hypothetical protein|tara:strand:+ start:211 stop:1059 length:849 start_codon:yes stop_codon:yes gene_type:complete